MSDYNLKLVIDTTDLKQIKDAGQRILLAKPVANGGPSTVWLAVDPFESNDVNWKEEYGLYASTTEMKHGAKISKLSETNIPAQDGALYDFTPENLFQGPQPEPSIPPGTFAALNQVPNSAYPVLTFGLTQSAMVNQKPANRKPISASPVLAHQEVEITPFTEVYVWLQANFESETIITKVTGKHAVARFGGGTNDVTMKYHPNVGMFVATS